MTEHNLSVSEQWQCFFKALHNTFVFDVVFHKAILLVGETQKLEKKLAVVEEWAKRKVESQAWDDYTGGQQDAARSLQDLLRDFDKENE